MNIVIIILAVIGSIIAIFLIAGLLLPRHFRIERQVTINRPKQQVFDYVKHIRNQESYSVWVMKDPKVKLVYSGTDGKVGFKSAWESDDRNVGIGEQEIKSIKDEESVEVEIRFKKPFEATNYALTTVSTTGDNQTLVTNEFYGQSKFPMNVMNLFMSKLVGGDMQTNLNNLKAKLEK